MFRRLVETVLLAAAEAAFQPGGPIPHSYRDIDYKPFFKRFLAASSDLVLGATIASIFIQWIAPVLLMGKFHRFSQMSLDDRVTLLAKMRHHRIYAIRGMFMIVNSLIGIPYYLSESVIEYLGYYGHRAGSNKLDGFLPSSVLPAEVPHAR